MDRIPTQLRALPYRLPQQNVRNKHENRPTKSERHTQHEGKRERAKFYYWNYQVTCRKSDVVIYSSSPKKKKQKKTPGMRGKAFSSLDELSPLINFLREKGGS